MGAAETLLPIGLLPSYLALVFGDLYEKDGLAVLGRGLQAEQLLAALIRFYADLSEEGPWGECDEETRKNQLSLSAKKPPSGSKIGQRPPLVLVLGLHREHDRATIQDLLTSWGTPPECMPTILTNESGQSTERSSLYATGGVFIVTSRILIVDLLSNSTLHASQIDGVLVYRAEKVTEQSTEAFCLRIIQSQRMFAVTRSPPNASSIRTPAFVKAISCAPEEIMSGFAKVDKILKALQVQNLYLYPRFHDSIREELEGKHPPTVIEYHQSLSPLQKEMQQALAVAVQACVRELKASTPLIDWTSTSASGDFSIEAIVTNPDQRGLFQQLEPEWHRLSPKTKQLVQDLRTLRILFQSLLLYDCVSFYKLLHSIKSLSASSRHPSLWLLSPAADALFQKAKERMYVLYRPEPTKQVPKPVMQCQVVLEVNPKWPLLVRVLSEIQEQHEERSAKQTEDDENAHDGPRHVLILVKDDRALHSIREYLANGKKSLWRTWLYYLEQYNDTRRQRYQNASSLSEDSRLLMQEEARARRVAFGKGVDTGGSKIEKTDLNHIPAHVRKRRRIAVEKGRGESLQQTDDLERQAVLDEAVEATERDLERHDKEIPSGDSDAKGNFMVHSPDESELRIVIKSYTSTESDQASLLMQDLQPEYVVFYDTDVAFVRAVEIHAALSTSKYPIQVYLLMFEASAEEKAFMRALEREQNAFERLIHHKKTMPPPALQSALITQEMQQAMSSGYVGGSYMDGSLPLTVDTRRGKGKVVSKEKRDVAVDVREFRSALPSILHQGGMRLAPVTLLVGDFVLSNVHCVERKSISDLFGSFASGRLYTQVEAMAKHYKVPCLLIEFDPNKSFSLQNANDLGAEIKTDSICTKLALLTMHFPKLRILWSKSPHETLQMFKILKQNHDEVDVDRAVAIGHTDSEENVSKDEEQDEVNDVARDMLLRMPGVNPQSARRIMDRVDSLAELSVMSRDDLRKVAGPVTGQKLFTFFRQKMTAAGL